MWRDNDFDFNDAVIRIQPDYENETCGITLMAVGSSEKMYLHYDGPDGDQKATKGSVAKNRLRTRLFVNGAINDDWTYTARLQNDQNLADNAGNEKTDLNQAYVTGRVGGLAVVAGKAGIVMADGNLYDDTAEFVSASYGKDVKLTAYAGQPTDYDYDKVYGAYI